jgi:SAM-dependent methyltransferase
MFMSSYVKPPKETWDESFKEAITTQSYNTAPVEALIRNIAYYLRSHVPADKVQSLSFLEMGCGAGPNLLWLAQRGIRVSGVDISPIALELARKNLTSAGFASKIQTLQEASVSKVPLEDESFDGILEACVFQHLDKADRIAAFAETKRLLKPGGLFVGYMLDAGHTTFSKNKDQELKEDPGTVILSDGKSKIYLTNIGLTHFFRKEEFEKLLPGFSVVDPCLSTYYLPREEAKKRGYDSYLQSMWAVYAIK